MRTVPRTIFDHPVTSSALSPEEFRFVIMIIVKLVSKVKFRRLFKGVNGHYDTIVIEMSLEAWSLSLIVDKLFPTCNSGTACLMGTPGTPIVTLVFQSSLSTLPLFIKLAFTNFREEKYILMLKGTWKGSVHLSGLSLCAYDKYSTVHMLWTRVKCHSLCSM